MVGRRPMSDLMPEPLLHATTSNFPVGHLIFSREDRHEKAYWRDDPGPWLCGYRLPPFQRPPVWTVEQAIRFLESAWMGLHLGTYVVNRCERWTLKDGKPFKPHRTDLWLIDGQQRLRALDAYLSDEWPVFGYRWSELPQHEQRRLENVTFAQSIVRESDEAVLRELYDRLNFGGTAHTEEQRASVTVAHEAHEYDIRERNLSGEKGGRG
jgi:hypothetical protein